MVILTNNDRQPKWFLMAQIERWNAGKGWSSALAGTPWSGGCRLPPEYLEMCTKPDEFPSVSDYEFEDQA
jgi:hypothetical protein